MKAVIVASILFVGSFANALTCQDGWGNSANVSIGQSGVSISSARYGSSGFLAANGESSTSYYFRSGTGKMAIVNKSVIAGGAGKVIYSYPRDNGRNGSESRVTFYCR